DRARGAHGQRHRAASALRDPPQQPAPRSHRVPALRSERSAVTDAVDLRRYVRDVPDFPKPGILFRDVTPLLGDATALAAAVDALAEPFRDRGVRKVLGIESRGFVFGSAVALMLGAGFTL